MNKKLLAIVLSSAIAVGGGVTTGVAISSSPKNVFMKSITGAIEDVKERDEIAPIINMLDGGSMEIVEDHDSQNSQSGGLSKINAGAKVYFEKERLMIKDLYWEELGLEGDVYLSEDLVYVKENKVIGKTVGIEKGELLNALEQSIFHYNSKSDYSLDEETYEVIAEMADNFDNSNSKAMKKDLEKLVKKYVKKFYNIICDNAEFESKTDDVRLNGERVKSRIITMTVDNYAIGNIGIDLADFLQEDDSVVNFLDKHMADQEFEKGKTASEIYEELIEKLDESAEDFSKDLAKGEDFERSIEIVTPKASKKLLKISFNSEKEELFVLDFGKEGVKDTNKIRFESFGEELAYEITKDDEKTFVAKLTLDKEELFKIDVNRKTNNYVATMDGVSINGKLSYEKGVLSITGDTLVITDRFGDIVTYELGVKIVITEKDKMPDVETDITTIDEITEKELTEWIEEIDDLL